MRMEGRDIGLCHLGDPIHARFGCFGGEVLWVGTRLRGYAAVVGSVAKDRRYITRWGTVHRQRLAR